MVRKEVEMPKVIQVIVSDDLRGNGKEKPYQRVPQLFTLDGQLICEMEYEDDKQDDPNVPQVWIPNPKPYVNYYVLLGLK